MQSTTIPSWELIFSIQRRLAMLSLLERSLKERQAILRSAYTDSFKALQAGNDEPPAALSSFPGEAT